MKKRKSVHNKPATEGAIRRASAQRDAEVRSSGEPRSGEEPDRPPQTSPQRNISVGSAGAFDATEKARAEEDSDEDNDDLARLHGR